MASFREVGIPDAGSKLLELRPLFPTSENFLMHSAARQTSHVSILQTCFFICSFVTPAVCKKMYVVPYYLTSPPPPQKKPKKPKPPKTTQSQDSDKILRGFKWANKHIFSSVSSEDLGFKCILSVMNFFAY